MILIVFHHYSYHGGFEFNSLSANAFLVQMLSLGGKLGVNLFVLISGYFLINSTLKLDKLVKIILQIFFWSFCIMLFMYMCGFLRIDFKLILKSISPISYGLYWFATAYVVLYVLTPFLNLFIKSLTKIQHLKLTGILVFVWCIIPTVMGGNLAYSNLGWFIVLYLIASYIRLHLDECIVPIGRAFGVAIISFSLLVISVILFDVLGMKYSLFWEQATYFAGMNKLPILVCAISLFLGFQSLSLRNNRLINVIASATFGVYLIHDNALMRIFLWERIFNNASYANSQYMIFHAIIVCMIVYFSCTVLELIRLHLIEKPIFKVLEPKLEKIRQYFNKFESFIEEKYLKVKI